MSIWQGSLAAAHGRLLLPVQRICCLECGEENQNAALRDWKSRRLTNASMRNSQNSTTWCRAAARFDPAVLLYSSTGATGTTPVQTQGYWSLARPVNSWAFWLCRWRAEEH